MGDVTLSPPACGQLLRLSALAPWPSIYDSPKPRSNRRECRLVRQPRYHATANQHHDSPVLRPKRGHRNSSALLQCRHAVKVHRHRPGQNQVKRASAVPLTIHNALLGKFQQANETVIPNNTSCMRGTPVVRPASIKINTRRQARTYRQRCSCVCTRKRMQDTKQGSKPNSQRKKPERANLATHHVRKSGEQLAVACQTD